MTLRWVAPASARAGARTRKEGVSQPVATEVDVMDSGMRAAPVTVTAIGRHLLAPHMRRAGDAPVRRRSATA
ncbi:hypothetical protein GCM10010451_06360 [Streptomyces virens]|uniref:HTH lysR-type domain-containing protein n=1 Tax=Streptomyces virens TaxID=285572 RepID=A0ABP6NXW1_9ACTN|nr:hypothetical protein GCM10010247_59980 [Streptomyces calvus]